VNIKKMTPSQIQFGIAPKRTREVEYVDDVIIMEEGDKAIRSMGGNGMSWTFDDDRGNQIEVADRPTRILTQVRACQSAGCSTTGLSFPRCSRKDIWRPPPKLN